MFQTDDNAFDVTMLFLPIAIPDFLHFLQTLHNLLITMPQSGFDMKKIKLTDDDKYRLLKFMFVYFPKLFDYS